MVYNFKSQLSKQMGDTIIAMSSNCTIYGENNCLHIKTNTRHIVFKFDGTPVEIGRASFRERGAAGV